MNILLNAKRPWQVKFPEENEHNEDSRLGERFAATVLVFYTSFALFISGWSALIITSGNVENGGPIGLIVSVLKTAGIL